jgi:hypothetical protein
VTKSNNVATSTTRSVRVRPSVHRIASKPSSNYRAIYTSRFLTRSSVQGPSICRISNFKSVVRPRSVYLSHRNQVQLSRLLYFRVGILKFTGTTRAGTDLCFCEKAGKKSEEANHPTVGPQPRPRRRSCSCAANHEEMTTTRSIRDGTCRLQRFGCHRKSRTQKVSDLFDSVHSNIQGASNQVVIFLD